MASLEQMQKGEITEHFIYRSLAERAKGSNRKILAGIAGDELRHYKVLASITKKGFAPERMKVRWYVFLARAFGLAFALKLMESGEEGAQESYAKLAKNHPALKKIINDEEEHEKKLIDLLSEERLEYASSIVLGLNDALVELTGALAGLTLAFQDGKFIAASGLILGFAAALSMAASSYLSAREEKGGKNPGKSAFYTGATYLMTVILLITPYFLFSDVYLSLGAMMATALLIICIYTFYITTAKSQRFLPRFAEMAAISLAVAAISFGMGHAARMLFGLGA